MEIRSETEFCKAGLSLRPKRRQSHDGDGETCHLKLTIRIEDSIDSHIKFGALCIKTNVYGSYNE